MREILFKAKRTDNGEWIYGGVYNTDVDGDGFSDIRCFVQKKHGVGMEVHPETVCQYTGLKDKNGTKIFEGDELLYKFHTGKDVKGYVKWYKSHTHFSCATINGPYSIGFGGSNLISIEITGNIHDK